MTHFSKALLAGGVLAVVGFSAMGVEPTDSKTAMPPVLTGGFVDHLQPVGGGKIDWTNGFILAEGTGRARDRSDQQKLMAEKAAEKIAARIQGLTQGGEILVSRAVADQLDGQLRLPPWKTVELRGAAGTYQLYELDPYQPV